MLRQLLAERRARRRTREGAARRPGAGPVAPAAPAPSGDGYTPDAASERDSHGRDSPAADPAAVPDGASSIGTVSSCFATESRPEDLYGGSGCRLAASAADTGGEACQASPTATGAGEPTSGSAQFALEAPASPGDAAPADAAVEAAVAAAFLSPLLPPTAAATAESAHSEPAIAQGPAECAAPCGATTCAVADVAAELPVSPGLSPAPLDELPLTPAAVGPSPTSEGEHPSIAAGVRSEQRASGATSCLIYYIYRVQHR